MPFAARHSTALFLQRALLVQPSLQLQRFASLASLTPALNNPHAHFAPVQIPLHPARDTIDTKTALQ